MTTDFCMVFFRASDRALNLDDTARLLGELGLHVTREDETLVVALEDELSLKISLSTEPHVAAEAAEIAEGTPFASALSQCDSRFEIAIDDLDGVLDEMNTLIEIQSALQDETGGYLFNSWNEELSPPTQPT